MKPFDFRELLARVRALLRRRPSMGPEVIQVGDLSVDVRSRTVSRGGVAIALTAKEFTLVAYLARHATGLGLSIARWVAEAHNGSLDLQDSADWGTTFVVVLPYEGASA